MESMNITAIIDKLKATRSVSDAELEALMHE